MTPEQIKLFGEYEALKIMIRDAEERLEEIKPQIIDLVPEDKEFETERGYFYIQQKAKWTYSPSTQEMEKAVKEEKKQEEADGTAVKSTSKVLYYKTGKPEENKHGGE